MAGTGQCDASCTFEACTVREPVAVQADTSALAADQPQSLSVIERWPASSLSPNTACLRGQACGSLPRTEWRFRGVVELSCCRRPARSWWRWLRGGPGSAATGCSRCCCGSGRAAQGWLKRPRWAGRFVGRALVRAGAPGRSLLCWPPAGPGLVGRWGPSDRPCGICGPFSLWPLGRYRAGPVIPSVGGVPG